MDPAPSLPTAATAPANPAAPPTADKRSALYDLTAFFLEGGIQIWVHITGKRIREADAPWLRCPLGERGRIVYTGWLRRLKSSGHVIYAGLYSTVQVPGEPNPCVKVTFPCNGSANVYLCPVAHPDGSFGLDSSGSAWGRSGFYRIVRSGADHRRVRYIKTLHELFHVYVDDEGVLRTEHIISFLGLTIIRLHYKMSPASSPASTIAAKHTPVAVA